jgi:hypothetical protein
VRGGVKWSENMNFISSLLNNYVCAFLHGIIHPLIILPFARRKWTFLIGVVLIGCLTLGEYWLLEDILAWRFDYAKAVLALTASTIGFGWILGFRPLVLLAAVITALLVDVFSHIMLSRFHGHVGTNLFPVLVIGQLAIYFAGFMMVRWRMKKTT